MERRRNRSRIIALAAISILNNKRRRRVWAKEYRQRFGHFPLIAELRQNYIDDYRNYLRMANELFDNLLLKVSSKISRKDTAMRKSINAKERLVATLRFLATGRSYEDLKFSTGISTASLSILIPETCKAIFEVLKEEYMKLPTTEEQWTEMAKGFEDRWQFINCGGAIDGKHIVPPAHSGATYYNYKNFHSIVLMAVVNDNYEFINVDVGKMEGCQMEE